MTATPNTAALTALLELMPALLDDAEGNCKAVEEEWGGDWGRQGGAETLQRIETARALLRALIATPDTEGR